RLSIRNHDKCQAINSYSLILRHAEAATKNDTGEAALSAGKDLPAPAPAIKENVIAAFSERGKGFSTKGGNGGWSSAAAGAGRASLHRNHVCRLWPRARRDRRHRRALS